MKNKVIVSAIFGTVVFAACGSAAVKTNMANSSNAGTANSATASTPAASPTPTPSAIADASSPAGVVTDLYKQHDAQKGPFFQTKDRAAVDKYFTKPLADLIWKDATTAGNEVGAIDGDPLYDAQDMEIKEFAVGEAKVDGDTAIVPVTFKNFDKKFAIDFAMKKEGDAWKIDNIIYKSRKGDSLMKWLKETYPDGKKN